jgi:hypothetical protein
VGHHAKSDNRFYWLGVDEILNPGKQAALIQGDISGGNTIRISSRGVVKCSVLLTSELIDWSKGVTVVLNNAPAPGYSRPKKLEPDLDLLLKDYRERGDRRVLLLGRLEFRTIP